jgi:hypothetical protein
VEVGKAEAKIGVAAKGSIEISNDSSKLSRSASIGVEAGQKGAKFGESISVQQTVMTVTDSNVTGAEKPEITRIDSLGLFGGNIDSSSDKVGFGLQLPAADLQDSLRNPGPPPTPPPPAPPTCTTNGDKKC